LNSIAEREIATGFVPGAMVVFAQGEVISLIWASGANNLKVLLFQMFIQATEACRGIHAFFESISSVGHISCAGLATVILV
jgi:hypothetical protein